MPRAARILVIDDDRAAVRSLLELLRGRGFSVRVALDGRDGHEKAIRHRPDLILLDVTMPDLDGHRACRLLKADPRTRDIPVIFLTGRDGAADKLAGFGAGGCDYVTKPYDPDELVARILVHQGIRRRLERLAGEAAGQESDDEEPVTRADRLVRDAIEMLRAGLADPPTLVDLARRAGTNERTLTELFRRRFGMPVFAWVREERFRRAADLLLDTELQVGQIASDVGYASTAAFSTAFRERYGLTPGAYRRSAGLVARPEDAGATPPAAPVPESE